MDPLTIAVLGIVGLVALTRKARPQSPGAEPTRPSDPEAGPRFVSAGGVAVYPQTSAPETYTTPLPPPAPPPIPIPQAPAGPNGDVADVAEVGSVASKIPVIGTVAGGIVLTGVALASLFGLTNAAPYDPWQNPETAGPSFVRDLLRGIRDDILKADPNASTWTIQGITKPLTAANRPILIALQAEIRKAMAANYVRGAQPTGPVSAPATSPTPVNVGASSPRAVLDRVLHTL